MCYVNSLVRVLVLQHNRDIDVEGASKKIIEFLQRDENAEHYMAFHPVSTKEHFIHDMKSFFDSRDYTQEILDVIIPAAAYALDIKLTIFKVGDQLPTPEGQKVIPFGIHQQTYNANASTEVNVQYQGSGIDGHYDALVQIMGQDDEDDVQLLEEEEEIMSQLPDILREDIKVHMKHEDKSRKKQRNPFREDLLKDVKPEYVDRIPEDIDGSKVYIIDNVEEDEWVDRQKDLRHFAMRMSYQKSFPGTRKVGWCEGSFICINPKCVFLDMSTKRNTAYFTKKRDIDEPLCFTCGHAGRVRPCYARKLTLYDQIKKQLTVKHINKHTCDLKVDYSKEDELIMHIIKENPSLPPDQLVRKHIEKYIRQKDMTGAIKAAEQLGNSNRIRYLMRRYREQHRFESTTGESMEALMEMRKTFKDVDKFWIYKLNSEQMNDEPTYVFKTSQAALRIAASMDFECGTSPMKTQECFFDGQHSRVKNFKTLSAYVYFPPMRRCIRLASMEIAKEDSQTIALFWKFMNEGIKEVTQGVQTFFNPIKFIIDAAGSNYCGLQDVYSEKYMQEKPDERQFESFINDRVLLCLMHYRKNMTEYANRIRDPEVKNEFIATCEEMVYRKSVTAFKSGQENLEKLSEVEPAIRGFVKFWGRRKYHVFGAFRGEFFKLSNWAESGHHSITTTRHPSSLVQAAFDDSVSFLWQAEQIKKFWKGMAPSTGRGPSQISVAKKEKSEALKRAKELAKAARSHQAMHVESTRDDRGDAFMPRKKESFKAKPKKAKKEKKEEKRDKGKKKYTKDPGDDATEADIIQVDLLSDTDDLQEVDIVEIPDNDSDEELAHARALLSKYSTSGKKVRGKGTRIPKPVQVTGKPRGGGGSGQVQRGERARMMKQFEKLQQLLAEEEDTGATGASLGGVQQRGRGRQRRGGAAATPRSASVGTPVQQRNVPAQPRWPENARIATNRPMVSFFQHFNIRVCTGCKDELKEEDKRYQPPKDLIFRMNVERPIQTRQGGIWWKPTAAYFHLNIACLQKIHAGLQVKHISCLEATYDQMTDANKNYLQRLGYLDHMERNMADLE